MNITKIDFIQPPFVFTADGKRLVLDKIDGNVRIGSSIEEQENGRWKVVGNNVDPDCVGGVCPIK